jgi:hypothetical protein
MIIAVETLMILVAFAIWSLIAVVLADVFRHTRTH